MQMLFPPNYVIQIAKKKDSLLHIIEKMYALLGLNNCFS